MLVYRWLKRSVPALLLLVAVACSGGLWKPLFTAHSVGRRGSRQFTPSESESLPAGSADAQSAAVPDRGDQISVHGGAASKVDDWVRTRSGWEHEAKWFATVGRYEPALHPAVVTALVSMASLWALVAFPAKAVGAADESNAPLPSDH